MSQATVDIRSICGNPEDVPGELRSVLACLRKLYLGKACDENVLSEKVIFEDPTVRCVGKKEVLEIFSAMPLLQPFPDQMRWLEICIRPSGEKKFTIQQTIHYFGMLPLTSEVVVKISMNGKVESIEDRWWGFHLLSFCGLAAIKRRLIGLGALAVTPYALRFAAHLKRVRSRFQMV